MELKTGTIGKYEKWLAGSLAGGRAETPALKNKLAVSSFHSDGMGDVSLYNF